MAKRKPKTKEFADIVLENIETDDDGLPVIPDIVKEAHPRKIWRVACAWLSSIDYYEDKTEKPSPYNRVDADHPNARSVGFAYEFILKQIHEEFPGSTTSLKCLRWYMTQINIGEEPFYSGIRAIQRRPRPYNKKGNKK